MASSGVGARITASVDFVEACLLRAWPGNVRELLAEAKSAALAATSARRARIGASDLDDEAGRAHAPAPASAAPAAPAQVEAKAPEPGAIEAALRAEQGNIARAAARLGLSRSRVRRFIERQGIDVTTLRSG